MPEHADRLVESVPNVSEGRRLDTVERLAEAISSVPNVHLLDRTSDASHNRSVFTLAGPAGAVSSALGRLVAKAIDEIDMDAHSGEHPRIGAVDVIPFVPLGDTSMEETVEIARDFAERLARTYELPVYLYAEAALRSERVKLADVRRGQYEGLKVEITQRGREPDFGPTRMHPSAGAVAVGARPFLIAYNINLDSSDKELAVRIARRIRESGGGLPKVQANGFFIDELDRAQVSMNLLDFRNDAALARLGDRPSRGGRGCRRAGGVRADRPRSAGRVPRRRRPRRRSTGRPDRKAAGSRGPLPPASRLLADAGARAPAGGRASGRRGLTVAGFP